MSQDRSSDTLLYWLSARGQVGDAKFRDACKRLKADPDQARRLYYNAGRCLHALGHVEKAESKIHNHRWHMLPPYALKLPQGSHLLLGARLPSWCEQLKADAATDFEIQAQPEGLGPERWMLKTIPGWLESQLVWVAPERGLDLLCSLPTLDSAVRSLPRGKPTTSNLQYYDFKGREWRKCRDTAHPGLYCKREQTFGVWFLVHREFIVEARQREQKALLFWWLKVRGRNFSLTYCQTTAKLRLSIGRYPLPVLLDRALRSASGLSPTYDSGHWGYSQIDLARAQRVSEILETRLERL